MHVLVLYVCQCLQAEQRSKRLTVSAICALAKLMETVGNETNERLCRAVGEQGSIPEGEQGDTGNDEVIPRNWQTFVLFALSAAHLPGQTSSAKRSYT